MLFSLAQVLLSNDLKVLPVSAFGRMQTNWTFATEPKQSSVFIHCRGLVFLERIAYTPRRTLTIRLHTVIDPQKRKFWSARSPTYMLPAWKTPIAEYRLTINIRAATHPQQIRFVLGVMGSGIGALLSAALAA